MLKSFKNKVRQTSNFEKMKPFTDFIMEKQKVLSSNDLDAKKSLMKWLFSKIVNFLPVFIFVFIISVYTTIGIKYVLPIIPFDLLNFKASIFITITSFIICLIIAKFLGEAYMVKTSLVRRIANIFVRLTYVFGYITISYYFKLPQFPKIVPFVVIYTIPVILINFYIRKIIKRRLNPHVIKES